MNPTNQSEPEQYCSTKSIKSASRMLDKHFVRSQIMRCLERMAIENRHLLDRNLKEECLNAAFCAILREEFGHNQHLRSLDYDIEYDKIGRDPKTMERLGVIRPDILVHQRGSQNLNFLYIEAKKHYLTSRDKDKLIKSLLPPYKYRFAVGMSYLPKSTYSRFCVLDRDETYDIASLIWHRTNT